MVFSMAKHELRKSEARLPRVSCKGPLYHRTRYGGQAAGPNKKKTPDNVLLPDVFRRGEKRFISS